MPRFVQHLLHTLVAGFRQRYGALLLVEIEIFRSQFRDQGVDGGQERDEKAIHARSTLPSRAERAVRARGGDGERPGIH